MRQTISAALLIFWLTFFTSALLVQASDKQREAFDAVKQLLPLVCGELRANGSSSSLEIAGNAEAKVNGLLQKLAALGISGSGKFNSESYVGVLRSEVGAELRSVRDCNMRIYEDMKELILNGNRIDNKGDGNVNIIGDSNKVNVK